jgi:LPXTG cell wall anchor motif
MTEPVAVSAAQIAAFTAAYQDNERPLQALNSRAFISTPATLPATGEAAVSGSEAFAAAGLLMMAAGLTLVLSLRRRG